MRLCGVVYVHVHGVGDVSGDEAVDVLVSQLRVPGAGRQQLHLRQQDPARGRRAHPDQPRRRHRPHPAPLRGPPLSQGTTPHPLSHSHPLIITPPSHLSTRGSSSS